MKQNNRRTKLKAIVAVVLVMASLFAMASLVSAGFVEEVFSEVCERMTASSSGASGCNATPKYRMCEKGNCVLGVSWSCGGCSTHQNKDFGRTCTCS